MSTFEKPFWFWECPYNWIIGNVLKTEITDTIYFHFQIFQKTNLQAIKGITLNTQICSFGCDTEKIIVELSLWCWFLRKV